MSLTLTAVCEEIRNWFEKDGMGRSAATSGDFVIAGGKLDLSSMFKEGQYYRIIGSALNDGIHKYGENDLTDESFNGEVHAAYIPFALVALLEEINSWLDKYGEVANSPYSSESFANYSYTKANNGRDANSGIGSGASTWQSMFASRLNRWRKVRE